VHLFLHLTVLGLFMECCCELVIKMPHCFFSDLPILLPDLLHVLSKLPGQLNFIKHTCNIGWKESFSETFVIHSNELCSRQCSKRSKPTSAFLNHGSR